jgi:hypothetical protein
MTRCIIFELLFRQFLSSPSLGLQRLGRDVDPTPRLIGLHLVSIEVIEEVGFPTL